MPGNVCYSWNFLPMDFPASEEQRLCLSSREWVTNSPAVNSRARVKVRTNNFIVSFFRTAVCSRQTKHNINKCSKNAKNEMQKKKRIHLKNTFPSCFPSWFLFNKFQIIRIWNWFLSQFSKSRLILLKFTKCIYIPYRFVCHSFCQRLRCIQWPFLFLYFSILSSVMVTPH